ncbi:hypothetical protein [Celerinatantimonas sp. MCCC 1A17872]|uniref:hypothetical protein n=1 Tax=Celerinatantimonas sp. MCCC 1A17872 TaxID=3177514 RepID=UPI0038C215B6
MNPLTRDQASKLIIEHGLAQFFIEVIHEKVVDPVDLYFACSPLYYMSANEQSAYKLGNVIPLWASHDGDINYAYDIEHDDFILFYLENGAVEKRYNYQQLMKEQLQFVIESECDDELISAEEYSTIQLIFSGLKLPCLDEWIQQIQD